MAYVRTYTELEEHPMPVLRFYLFNSEYRWEFTNMVRSHAFSGEIDTAAESFSVSVWNRQESNGRRKLPFREGAMIKVTLELQNAKGRVSKPQELFRGVVIARSLNAEGEEVLSLFDYNWYLAQNEITKSFRKRRADQIIAELGRIAGVPVGHLANTGYVFPKLEFVDVSIWEVIQTVLTETFIRTGKRYKVRSEAGKLALREVAVSMNRLIIERGANLLSANRDLSIENVKTQVIMTGGQNPDNPRQVRSDATAKRNYGTMTVIENDPDVTGPGGLGTLASALLKQLKEPSDEISVSAIADYSITAGSMIEVYDDFTGATGYYYVTSHNHDNGRVMSLQLSKQYEQKVVRYEAPRTNEERTASSGSGAAGSTGSSRSTGTAAAPRASSKQEQVVAIARSYKGKLRYKFGGKNIDSGAGDCSGFTYVVMQKVGVNIGHGTTSQVTKGRKVSKSAAQPGDLVFFKGTYRAGVSHVGIVTTPGMCVSLASSGCIEHSYTSGYWGNHFMQINRVL